MLLALLLAAGSALLGGALALAARTRPTLLEVTRTFAFAAAGGVVALHLFPELLRDLGARGLLWAALGFAVPGLLEAGARALGPGLRGRGFSGARVAAETGFVALAVHSLLEGLALRAAAAAPGAHADLQLALVAHHAPLTAAVALPLLELYGARATAWRILIIAAAGALGALLGGSAGVLESAGVLGAAGGVMAGALLHVVADEIRPQPRSPLRSRLADLAAAAAGLGVATLSAFAQEPGPLQTTAALAGIIHQTGGLLLVAAPALLAGDLLTVALARRTPRRLAPLLDLPGASLATLLVTLRMVGALPTAARLLLALGAVFGGALLASLWPLTPHAEAGASGSEGPRAGKTPYLSALLAHLAEWAPRRLAVLLFGGATLGLLAGGAGFPRPPAPPDPFTLLLVLGACSVLSSAAAAALSPLVFALVPAVPALVAMVVLPALLRPLGARTAGRMPGQQQGTSPLIDLRSGPLGRRLGAGFFGATGALAASLLLRAAPAATLAPQALAGALATTAPLQTALLAQAAQAPLSALCLVLLVLPLVWTVWRAGPRGWLVPLRHGGEE